MLKSDYLQKVKLIEFSRALGQEPEPELVAQVAAYAALQEEIRENARLSIMQDLSLAIQLTKQQITDQLVQEQPRELPEQPSLDDLENFLMETQKEDEHDLDTQTPKEIPQPSDTEPESITEQTLTDLVAQSISVSAKKDSFQHPITNSIQPDVASLAKKLQKLESWLGKISAHGPGSGTSSLGFIDMPHRTVTAASYMLTSKDYYVGVNRTGKVELSLPAFMNTGKVFVIKDELGEASRGTNRHIYVYPPTGELIDGQNYVILAYDYGSLTFIKRDGYWSVV